MLHLIENFINQDCIDLPEYKDDKENTLKLRPKLLKVLVYGTSCSLALPLLYSIARGYIFGDKTLLVIILFDFTKPLIRHAKALEAELSLGAFKLLADVIVSTTPNEAFKDIDVAILLESPPEDSKTNLDIQFYKCLGDALNQYSKKSVKVITVGGNVNTKSLICSLCAPSIPPQNFTGLCCHIALRTCVCISQLLKTSTHSIKDISIWGIDTIDVSMSTIARNNSTSDVKNINEELNLINNFLKKNEQYNWDCHDLCMLQALSIHTKALMEGTESMIPMVVFSEGCYGLDKGLFISLPVTIDNKQDIYVQKDLVIQPDVYRKLLSDLEILKQDKTEVWKVITEKEPTTQQSQ